MSTIAVLGVTIPGAAFVVTVLVLLIKLAHLMGRLTERIDTHGDKLEKLETRQATVDVRCDARQEVLTRVVTVVEALVSKVDLLLERSLA